MDDVHAATLKALQMKATPKRVAILEALQDEQRYASPEELWQRLRPRFIRIGLPTVYRNLEDLAASGVISKVIHPNRQLYYYFCPNRDHHHHFVCLSCRKVEDLPSCTLEPMEREITARTGGKVLSHIVQFNGLCGKCMSEKGDAAFEEHPSGNAGGRAD
ncbi:transcriptional repressor [Geomonas sp. RF6]|uniref:Fur family transcriptional regulator n=1 Tax=Geomonas sp. RF6 TaxID=2897342 RepID=UPI001E58F4F9|nr:transcriptional repressor [Geomonas sp. RF6]UFS71802.1 transcriptional repressor [Geomonas sp. RF6]